MTDNNNDHNNDQLLASVGYIDNMLMVLSALLVSGKRPEPETIERIDARVKELTAVIRDSRAFRDQQAEEQLDRVL
jgi:hypothetical protein